MTLIYSFVLGMCGGGAVVWVYGAWMKAKAAKLAQTVKTDVGKL